MSPKVRRIKSEEERRRFKLMKYLKRIRGDVIFQ